MLRDKRFIAVILVALIIIVVLDVRYFMNRSNGRSTAHTSMVQPSTPTHPLNHTNTVLIDSRQQVLSPARQVAAWNRDYPLKAGSRNPFHGTGPTRQTKLHDKSGGQSSEEMESGPISHLGAIAVVDGKMLALIDGEPVVKNGSMGNMEVVYIGPDGVTLRQGADRWAEALPPLPADAVNVVRRH